MLIEVLEARQRALELTDGEFARRLGISRPLWVATRTGRRVVSLRLLRGVVHAFPDLETEVLACLRRPGEDREEVIV